jgi:peptide/nickel transport system permease protein/dipeptide transport system permease protein
MARYLARRFVSFVAVMLAMTFIVFCLQSIIPTDPARAAAGPLAPPAVVEALREKLGLNEPTLVQYGRFLSRLSQGDLGTSVRTRQSVAADISKYLPASAELCLVALLIGLTLATLFAFLQTGIRGKSSVRLVVIALGSTPIFLSSLLLAYFIWFRLGWLPVGGRLEARDFVGPTGLNIVDGLLTGRPEISIDALRHLVLPAAALAMPLAVALGRSLASALRDTMKQPYVRTARGQGVSELALVLRHGLRNSATAPLTMFGIQFAIMLSNLMIVERIFAWPGLGFYAAQAFTSSDLPAVLGVTIVFGAIYIAVSVAIELGQSLADPRIAL